MDAGKGFADFMKFLEALETETGEVWDTEKECPGVWYVCTGGDGERDRTEFNALSIFLRIYLDKRRGVLIKCR